MVKTDSELDTSPWKPTPTAWPSCPLQLPVDTTNGVYVRMMTSREMEASEAALIPLLVGKQRCNITFVLSTSECMRTVLGPVKSLLIQSLLTKASLRDSLFNIMTYSNKVNCWSNHMLPCGPDTVYTALSWIHSISYSPGGDLLGALSLALTDPACHAVHLLTRGLPDQPEAVLRALPALAPGRPVNIFHVQDWDGQLDIHTRDFLQCFTQATGGSCYVMTYSSSGKLGKVVPLFVAESRSSGSCFPPARCWCPSASVMNTPLLRCSLENPVRPLTSRVTPGSEFSPGSRVLARREEDGFYYLGTVIQQVQTQGRTGVWLVEFGNPGAAGSGAVSSLRQLVCSPDMVKHHTGHQTHRLLPGDAVLSPWEPRQRRYGPGRVIAATGHRGGLGVDGVASLRVQMWNSCVSLVPDGLVSPISASHYDRMVRELRIPKSAQRLKPSCSWLCARSSSCIRCSAPTLCCCSATRHRACTGPPRCGSSLGGMFGSEGTEGDTQVDLQDTNLGRSNPEASFSSSSSSSSSSLTEVDTRTFPPTVKLRSKQHQRPPWRYWRRTGPEPQHTQPGCAVDRRISPPSRFIFPVPQMSASPNHSSLFQSLPGAGGRTATHFTPRPSQGLRPFSRNDAAAVYTC